MFENSTFKARWVSTFFSGSDPCTCDCRKIGSIRSSRSCWSGRSQGNSGCSTEGKGVKNFAKKRERNFSAWKALTNIELEEILKNEPGFRGVFTRDTLPKRIRKHECGIVNLDTLGGKGTHWVSYLNKPNEKYVEYFDSYGLAPPEELENYLLTSQKLIIYNSTEMQKRNSELCGYFCIFYIRLRNRGVELYSVLNFLNAPIWNW